MQTTDFFFETVSDVFRIGLEVKLVLFVFLGQSDIVT